MTLIDLRNAPPRRYLAALAMFSLIGATSASAQYETKSAGATEGRYEARADEGRGLFGGLFGGGDRQRPSEPRYAQAGSPSELAVRLERLESQIRQLTGAIEQLQHRNQQLEQIVRRNQEDMEYRFQEAGIRGGNAPRRPPPAGVQAPAPSPSSPPPASSRRSDVFDPAENPGAPGAPQVLGSLPERPGDPPAPILADDPPAGGPGGRDAGAPLDLGMLADRAIRDSAIEAEPRRPPGVAAPSGEPRTIPGALPPPPPRVTTSTGAAPTVRQMAAAPTATPRDELAMAQGFIQRRDYGLAEESLRAFLKKYPGDRLAPDAHYWLGESLFQRRQFRDAAESFLTVSTQYEKSPRAPDALLRLGQSLAGLGEREAACATLNEVGRKFPRASNNVKQAVEREQKRVRC